MTCTARAALPAGEFLAVSAGSGQSTCGLRYDKEGRLLGLHYGELSNALAGDFLSVSVGDYHVCGLRVNNTIACRSPLLVATPHIVEWIVDSNR